MPHSLDLQQGYTPKPLSRHMAGLLWSAVAIVGRPMASALRKELATPRAAKAVSNAEQVGMTSLIQGAWPGVACLGWPVWSGRPWGCGAKGR